MAATYNDWLDVDNNYANAANWTLGVPVATQDVRIRTGTKDITSGLNQSAVTLNSFLVTGGYAGSIGTVGTSLQIAVNNVTTASETTRIAMVRGYCYLSPVMNGDTLYIDSASGGAGVAITGGTLDGAYAVACGASGSVKLASGITTLSGIVISCGIGLTIEKATSSNVELWAGNHIISASLTGTTIIGKSAYVSTTGTAAMTTVDLQGTLIPNSSGTLGTVYARPGCTFRPGGAKDLIITNLYRYAGSSVTLKVEGATVTVTNDLPFGVK